MATLKKKLTPSEQFKKTREKWGYNRDAKTNRITRPTADLAYLEKQKTTERKRILALYERQISTLSEISNSKLRELNSNTSVKSLSNFIVNKIYAEIKNNTEYRDINPQLLKTVIKITFYKEFQKVITPTKLKNLSATDIYEIMKIISERTKYKFKN